MLISLLCIVLVGAAVRRGVGAFGPSDPPPYLASVGEPFAHVDWSGLPAAQTTLARDKTPMTFRVWPAAQPSEPERVVIAIHGSSAHSSSMHPLAKALQAEGIAVYAPDIRGHGGTGRRGDIDYAGQLDDDAADFVAIVRPRHPNAQLVLMGFSSGGGYALHLAGSPLGKAFARTVLISPFLGPRAPIVRPNVGGWAKPFLPRIIALVILGKFGIHAFD